MKYSNALLLLLLPLCGCGPSPKDDGIPSVTAYDLYANPEKYNNQEIEVTGRIIVAFEHRSLVCLDENKQKPPLLWGIWISADLDSIQKRSLKFYEQIKEGFDLASAWKAELRGNMRCRGHFKLSDDWLKRAAGAIDKDKAEFMAIFGAFDASFVIKEVLDYQPQIYAGPAGFVLPYEAFGPPSAAHELIGMNWWQWLPHGDSRPRAYPVNVVVYWNQTLEQVKEQYPVDEAKEQDYRYVEFSAAVPYWKKTIKDMKDAGLDASRLESALRQLYFIRYQEPVPQPTAITAQPAPPAADDQKAK